MSNLEAARDAIRKRLSFARSRLSIAEAEQDAAHREVTRYEIALEVLDENEKDKSDDSD